MSFIPVRLFEFIPEYCVRMVTLAYMYLVTYYCHLDRSSKVTYSCLAE